MIMMVCCCPCFIKKRLERTCNIVLLDETEIEETVQSHDRGEDLLLRVCSRLDLLETAYFGLRYLTKDGQSRWIDPVAKVSSQLKGLPLPHTLYFGVKFYASDPCKLVEEVTRYQFVLQLKQDILLGRLPVSDDLVAELFAYSLQAELGDHDPRRNPPLYSSEFRFVPNQSPEIEEKAEKLHKTLKGQVPSLVEMKFLEKVKWLDLYGVDLHPVTGDKDVLYYLGLTPSGILVVKDRQRVNNFFWPRIIRVFFKGKRLMIRIRDKANDETIYTFLLPSRESSEYLWRCCVEHHSFFRLTQIKDSGNPMHQLFKLGSKHRYSGRTEHQALAEGRRSGRTKQKFDRIPSKRKNRRTPLGAEKEPVQSGRKSSASEPTATVSRRSSIKPPAADDTDALQKRLAAEAGNLYRSASTPAVLNAPEGRTQKLESVKVPPWEDPNHAGLFASRHSLASSRGSERRSSHRHRRSGSVESGDSRRRRHRSHRGCSDNESDVSRSSRGSRTLHSHRRRRSYSRGGSGSDSEKEHKSRRRKHCRHSGSSYNLVESESQWKMVQQKQRNDQQNGSLPKFQSAVVRDLSATKKSGYANSGVDTESEAPVLHRKKHRRRSRSRSPDSGPVLTQDVKKHIEYKLVDPADMTEEEKKDIKYTRIESEASVYRIRCSPAQGKQKYKVSRISSTRSSQERKSGKGSETTDKSASTTPRKSTA